MKKVKAYFTARLGALCVTDEDGAKLRDDLLYSIQHLGYVIPPQADCGLRSAKLVPDLFRRRCDGRAGYESEFTHRIRL